MSDEPYRDHVRLLPGERVGWVDLDGTMYTGVIQDPIEIMNREREVTIVPAADAAGTNP